MSTETPTAEDTGTEPEEMQSQMESRMESREHAAASAPTPPTAPQRSYETQYDGRYDKRSQSKSPMLAAFFSLLPGLGNLYNGLYARGFVFFLLVVSLFYATVDYGSDTGGGPALALLIPTMVFVWLFNIFDAYRQATLINWGGYEDESPDLLEQRKNGTLAAGVALFVLGLYGLLEQFFDIDLTVLLDYWFVAVMAFGGWLIYQAKTRDADEALLD